MLLRVEDIEVRYDEVPALRDVSLEVHAGEIVAVIGSNGTGKTTLLRAISGIRPPARGRILLDGTSIHTLKAHQIAARGISHVPEGRGVFAQQTVLRNLYLGAFLRTEAERDAALGRVFDLFPILAERRNQMAGTLSGGEQQMLAIGRGLMANPHILMLDEPSLGLMPKLVDTIFELVQRINAEGDLTILLVEQNVRESLEIANRAYVLETGNIALEGAGEELLESELVQKAYLGM
ncbi:MAG: High-affinity branched-chain amino acid transport ATP-binding protein LivF [Anaerolineales bacterium]|nr:High-affinity branched-chain amino acid transport ATP-binding protein LivF [Anaerolineales bacterium]